MKIFAFFLLILFLGISGMSIAQTVNNVPLKDVTVDYVQIVGTSRLLSNKVTVEIDFGQENSIWTGKDTELRDVNGKRIIFNSMIDALNFMTRHGYEYVDSYAISISTSQQVYHFLLRRKWD